MVELTARNADIIGARIDRREKRAASAYLAVGRIADGHTEKTMDSGHDQR